MNNLVAAVKNGKTVSRIRDIRDRAIAILASIWLALYTVSPRVYAATADAETLWATVTSTIQTWVLRMGAVIMFVGLCDSF